MSDRGTSRGKPYYPGYFTTHFRELSVRHGLPVIALHDARHSMASVASGIAGVDLKTLRSRLGHADPGITAKIYLHALLPVLGWRRTPSSE